MSPTINVREEFGRNRPKIVCFAVPRFWSIFVPSLGKMRGGIPFLGRCFSSANVSVLLIRGSCLLRARIDPEGSISKCATIKKKSEQGNGSAKVAHLLSKTGTDGKQE